MYIYIYNMDLTATHSSSILLKIAPTQASHILIFEPHCNLQAQKNVKNKIIEPTANYGSSYTEMKLYNSKR